MPTDSGYSNQKKKGLAQFETVQSLGSNGFGKVVAVRSVYDKDLALSVSTIDDVLGNDGQVKYWSIGVSGHSAVIGDMVRFDQSSTLPGFEFEVQEVPDGNTIYILPITDSAPIVGDMFDTLGWVTNKVGPDGSISVTTTTAPTQYNYDGSPQTVEQDTADPTLNRALPNLLFITVDGIQYPVTKDTSIPSNTVSIPVELSSVSGPINITAGDLNVQLSDQGPNADVTRIGDGTNQWGINASNEGKVHDEDVYQELVSLNAATSAILAPSFQEILNLTTVAQTFTAPAGAKWCKISADAANSQNIRVKMGGTAATASGIRMEPSRTEDFAVAGNISVIAEAGTNQAVCVIFGA